MANKREKVVVAMSGGVDSSVAACLLVERGYDVTGLFMRIGVEGPDGAAPVRGRSFDHPPPGPDTPLLHGRGSDCDRTSRIESTSQARKQQSCCSQSDAADACLVAGMLGIPFFALNFQSEFNAIIDYFADEYIRGRTPNPCIMCNTRLKFGKLLDYADAVGAKYIATGHYARTERRNGRSVLLRARDLRKDQSYVLFGLNPAILDRAAFPVGELAKSEVREMAARFGLPNRDKPDSVEICFASDRDYARVVRERRPEAFVDGDVLDCDGRVIGRHQGIARYTIGQRRGLGIAAGKPIYVTQLNAYDNTVIMGDNDALMASTLMADRANFLVDVPHGPFRAGVKIRYLHEAAPATVERLDGDKVRVVFDEPQRAITPGQAVVFYDGSLTLGGGWIECVESAGPSPAVLRTGDCRL